MTTREHKALEGRRILDLGGLSSAYCGKLLADLGAEVIKVEAPGGDPGRRARPMLEQGPGNAVSLPFAYLNAGKRSVVLDLDAAPDRERFLSLARTSDLVIDDHAPAFLDDRGLGYADLAAADPRIVLTSLTPFGRTGPRRDHRGGDLVASAMGGAMTSIGMPEDPPVRQAGHQAEIIASTCAAAASLIALRHRDRSGQGQLVDISMMETIVSVTHVSGVGNWLEDGIIPRRAGTGLVAAVPSGAYPCKDGFVYLIVNRAAHWQALAEWIHEVTGNEEVLQEVFHGPSSMRIPYRELLDLFISDMTSQFTVQEVYHEGQRRHIAFSPIQNAAEVAADAHLEERAFFQQVEVGNERFAVPGAPYRHAKTPARIQGPVPAIGQDDFEALLRSAPGKNPGDDAAGTPTSRTASTDALAGLRVVEFGTGMAGPWVGRFMSWCGAEIIKVESVRHPDVPRSFIPPRNPELGIQPESSPWFTDWNAGKRCVALDLSKPEGAELCRRLVETADVVVSNYSSGVLEKFGLGYERLCADNPELVMLASTGYGDFGPQSSYVTWGPNIEALSGLAALSGFPDRECTMTHYAYPDPLGALHGLVGVLAALDHRERGGGGQSITQSQYETAVASLGRTLVEQLALGREPVKLGNGSLDAAPHGCFPCSGEDRWCALSVDDDAEWSRLCTVLDRPEWVDDPRFSTLAARRANEVELAELIGEWTRVRTDFEVMDAWQAAGLAAGVVQNAEDHFERDPQLKSRGFFEDIAHFKKGTVTAAGIPLGLTGTPGHTRFTGTSIGQDNESVFRDVVGLTREEYERALAEGAIEFPEPR